MMDTNKIREEFEAWQAKETPGADLAHCGALIGEGPARESYRNMYVAERWIGWQASRAALVIELPAENPIGSGSGDCEGGLPSFEQHCAAECNFILRDCREAIEAAGLKVKP